MRPGWEPVRAKFADGRWHFQNGPIDLLIEAQGNPDACAQAHEECWQNFQPVLQELVGELQGLRSPLRSGDEGLARFRGAVARRMALACLPHANAGLFITPMAAVAGSVADHLIACYRRPGIRRAYINNGGDIALHLERGERWRAGVVANAYAPGVGADLSIEGETPWRGLATSGWRGRSLSLGIADSVTVVAVDAATADAAATIIANHVNVEHSAIERRPASLVRDDSDLGDLPVTVGVGSLPNTKVDEALARGLTCARELVARKLIAHALLSLSERWVHTGNSLLRECLIEHGEPAQTTGHVQEVVSARFLSVPMM